MPHTPSPISSLTLIHSLTNSFNHSLTLTSTVFTPSQCTKRFRAWEIEERKKQEDASKLESAAGGGPGLTDGFLPTRPRFLIIGFSANSDADTKKEALAAGMDFLVNKPFSILEFKNLLISQGVR